MLTEFINLTNHGMVVEIEGVQHKVVYYKNKPEVITQHKKPEIQYSEIPVPNEIGVDISIPVGVKHLPFKFKDSKLIVSKETVSAVDVISKYIMSDPKLKQFMKKNNFSTQKDLEIRLRYIGYNSLYNKWPEFYIWLNGYTTEPKDTFKRFKMFLNRDDLYRPGKKIRARSGEVTACKGLYKYVPGGSVS